MPASHCSPGDQVAVVPHLDVTLLAQVREMRAERDELFLVGALVMRAASAARSGRRLARGIDLRCHARHCDLPSPRRPCHRTAASATVRSARQVSSWHHFSDVVVALHRSPAP